MPKRILRAINNFLNLHSINEQRRGQNTPITGHSLAHTTVRSNNASYCNGPHHSSIIGLETPARPEGNIQNDCRCICDWNNTLAQQTYPAMRCADITIFLANKIFIVGVCDPLYKRSTQHTLVAVRYMRDIRTKNDCCWHIPSYHIIIKQYSDVSCIFISAKLWMLTQLSSCALQIIITFCIDTKWLAS